MHYAGFRSVPKNFQRNIRGIFEGFRMISEGFSVIQRISWGIQRIFLFVCMNLKNFRQISGRFRSERSQFDLNGVLSSFQTGIKGARGYRKTSGMFQRTSEEFHVFSSDIRGTPRKFQRNFRVSVEFQ